ncbi:MAG: hypothetical protein NTY13_06080 [Chlamydiae bacterium]|nr:hypothetical protein [Chlamydiota bacterium]
MVKFFSLLIMAFFLTGSLTASENMVDPLCVICTEEQFSITFPKGFSHAAKEEDSIETELGVISTVNYVSFNDTSVAMAGAGCYPENIAISMDREHDQLFTLAKESLMASLSATPLKTFMIDLQELPTLEVEFVMQMEQLILIGKARFVFDGKRLYSVIFITSDPSTLAAPEVNDFFNSFVVIPKK